MKEARDFSEFRAHWPVLVAAALGIGLGWPSLGYSSIGIFAPDMARDLGWPFAGIFAGLAFTPVALLLGGPFIGGLLDRYSVRNVTAISLVLMGLAYMTLAFSGGSMTQYYVSWALITVVGLGATPISFTRVINSVFVTRRGLALGGTLSGLGLFAVAVKPLGAALTDAFGWRGAMVGIGLLPILVAVPLVLWGFPRTTAAANTASRPGQDAGLSLREALRTRTFWVLLVTFVPAAFAIGAPIPNIENILLSTGIARADLAGLAAIVGATQVIGRLAGGWMIDRVWAPAVGIAVLLMGAAADVMLAQSTLTPTTAAIALGLLGFAGGVEVDLLAYLIARYFGMRHYGAIYGAIYGCFAVGAGAGPTLFGYAFDRYGGYTEIMTVGAVMLVAAAATMLLLGRYPDHWKE